MTGLVTGQASEAAMEAAIKSVPATFHVIFANVPAGIRLALAAAYAVDEPRIRADQTQRIVEWLRAQARAGYPERVGKLHDLADDLAREFGTST